MIFDYKRDYSNPDFVQATGALQLVPLDRANASIDFFQNVGEKTKPIQPGNRRFLHIACIEEV